MRKMLRFLICTKGKKTKSRMRKIIREKDLKIWRKRVKKYKNLKLKCIPF